MRELTEYIKKAFDYKQDGCYKEAIDYFYKALALDNTSTEIMGELACLYAKLHQYDRAASFYEQVLSRNPDDYQTRFEFALMYKKNKDYIRAEEHLVILFGLQFEQVLVAEELFDVLLKQNKYDKIIEFYNLRANFIKSSLVCYYVGKAYLEIGKNKIADEFFKQSFDIDENNIEAGCHIAEMLFNSSMYQESEDLLKKLLSHSENDRIYFLFAEIDYVKGRYDSAIKNYSLAIKQNDKNAEYFFKLGVVYALKGFLVEAEESYVKAISIERENLLYNYTLAYLYFMDNQIDRAKRIVEYILLLNENYLSALSLKLLIVLKQNDITIAKKIIEKLNEIQEKDEFSYYAICLYYSCLNLWVNAISNIEKAIFYNPKSCEYNYELAKCYYNIKNYDKTIEICEKIISVNSKYINSYILLAKVYYEQAKNDEAIHNVDIALKLDMNIPEAYFIKGSIYKRNNSYEKAIDCFKTAITMAPNIAIYYASVAQTYYQIQDYENASIFFKEVADIDVSNSEYKYYYAKCLEQLGNYENAIANYSFAKRISPQNLMYLIAYAELLSKMNEKQKAIKLVKSSMKFFSKEEKETLKELLKKI